MEGAMSEDIQRGESEVSIRRAEKSDAAAIWAILEPVFRAGETYPLPREMSEADALEFWMANGHEVFVAEDLHCQMLGTYFLRANQRGGGAHVANCGYVTATWANGRGVARKMCAHSLKHAKARGFRAMQFNFVVSTNERAVRLWESFGFRVVGRLPGAFQHAKLGFVDALVMYHELGQS
jgi:ribosomal protein S18 acetylase RimI-like enzyme